MEGYHFEFHSVKENNGKPIVGMLLRILTAYVAILIAASGGIGGNFQLSCFVKDSTVTFL